MTQTQHFTSVATWTVPANITRARAVVAGGKGGDSASGGKGGLGGIVEALVAVAGSVSVGAGSIAGGSASGGSGVGGAGSSVAGVYGPGGGGAGRLVGLAGNTDGRSADGSGGTTDPYQGGMGGTDGTGGLGGVAAGGANGLAGGSHATGGTGGAGISYGGYGSGAGGGGYAGGGSGSALSPGSGLYVTHPGGAGSLFGGVLVGLNNGAPYVDLFWASAPLVPTLLTPAGSAYADRTLVIPLTFQHNGASADVLDVQSDADVRHRKVGAATWTTVAGLGTATSTSIAANTYADGDQVEWQARTYADGQQGPWSASEYFIAANPPATPVFTSPTAGQTFGTAAISGAWTHVGQVMYQYRVVSDVSGSAGATVYADSGPVTSADMTATLTVKINTVDAHLQVRVRDIAGGLWSQWADVQVSISWEPPATPTVYQQPDPEHGSIVMVITNPTPTGTQPAPSVNRVYVTEDGIETRRALTAPGANYEYWVPVGEIGVRVEAVDESTGVLSSTEVIW